MIISGELERTSQRQLAPAAHDYQRLGIASKHIIDDLAAMRSCWSAPRPSATPYARWGLIALSVMAARMKREALEARMHFGWRRLNGWRSRATAPPV